jgi:hypothetical protein
MPFMEVFPIGLVITTVSAGILCKKARNPENETSKHKTSPPPSLG